MSAFSGERAEFIRLARIEIERISELPLEERDEAYNKTIGPGALRSLAGVADLAPNWLEGPSNRSVSFEYLTENPAPTILQLNLQYTLEVNNGILLMQVMGVKGEDESGFRVKALLMGRRKGTILFAARTKKTRDVLTGRTVVSGGRISAAGTGKSKVYNPTIGKEYTLKGEERDDLRVKIVAVNLEKALLWARPVS
jgi:hypothetical protein